MGQFLLPELLGAENGGPPELSVPPLRPPGVIAEMIELLQASPVSSSETLIRWGLLPELPTKRERVYLLGTTDYALEPNTRAHHVRREDFGVRGLVEVHQLGDDGPGAAGTRAWALLSGLDAALYREHSLSNGASLQRRSDRRGG